VHDIDAEQVLQVVDADVRDEPEPERAVRQLARLGSRERDQLLEGGAGTAAFTATTQGKRTSTVMGVKPFTPS